MGETLTLAVDSVVREHSDLHARLAEWEEALAGLENRNFQRSQAALQKLWRLVPFFEEEVPRHFRHEEGEFHAALKVRYPDSAKLLAKFAGEHAEWTRGWRDYRMELLYADAVGETNRLYELGTELVARLRRHMQDEELELVVLARQQQS
ncbi:MAG: hemerythrin domain-containing protein [Candidatus Acidiferrales bacterium]